MTKTTKPLGGKCYGSICHLPGSRLGPGDHKLNEGQARILTERARDVHDLVIVQEKLDGSNVGVARVDGILIPLIRAGYPAISSKYDQHRLFADWVYRRLERFEFLREGERLCGEWLAQAHGTRYNLPHEPFVAFDLIRGDRRVTYKEFKSRVKDNGFTIPFLIHVGGPIAIADAMFRLFPEAHGAIDPIEGCVWRVERRGHVDFLGKYVRPDKKDGCYLPEVSGQDAVWNWKGEPSPQVEVER